MPRHPEPPRLKFRQRQGRAPWYEIVWHEGGKLRRRSTGTGSRAEANRALAEFRETIRPDAKGRPLDEIAIGDLLDRYADSIADRAAPERIGYAIMALAPFWAALSVADVSQSTCRAYQKARRRAPGTVRRELGALKAALRYAEREGDIPAAPTVWLPPRPDPKPDWLTRADLARLVRAARQDPRARGHLPWFILLAYYTGGRKRAVLDLRWRQSTAGGHVNLETDLIDLNPRGRSPTKKRRGVCRIPPQLAVLLEALRKRRPNAETVVARRNGQAVADVKHSFQTAAIAAKIPWATPHILRHTCITHMMMAGANPYDVSKWAAISLEELERTYGHHAPEYLQAAAQTWRRRPA